MNQLTKTFNKSIVDHSMKRTKFGNRINRIKMILHSKKASIDKPLVTQLMNLGFGPKRLANEAGLSLREFKSLHKEEQLLRVQYNSDSFKGKKKVSKLFTLLKPFAQQVVDIGKYANTGSEFWAELRFKSLK